jgi:hypothetical protein
MSLEGKKHIELLMREQVREFQVKLETFSPTLMREYPIASYLSELRKRDYYSHYEIFSSALNQMLESIMLNHGQDALALFHKLALSRLIIDFISRTDNINLPETLWPFYASWFARINSDFSTQPNFYYDLNKIFWPLRKDLCVCSGRAIPVGGAWVVENRFIPRQKIIKRARRLSKGGRTNDHRGSGWTLPKPALRTFAIYKIIRSIFYRAKRLLEDYDLCFVLHTVERDIINFNEEQMNLAYKNIVELLKRDKRVWGVFRSSWFLDPALHKISPHMAYLSSVPQANGAELYCEGPCSGNEIKKATQLSPQRSQMYQQGSYKPQRYFYFWPRQAVIDGHYDKY